MVAPRGSSSPGSAVPQSAVTRSMIGRRAAPAPLWAAPVPLLVTGTTGVIRFANRAAARQLGTEGELDGRPILGLVHPADRGLLARRMSVVASGDATSDILVRLEGAERLVPCLIGGAPTGGDAGSDAGSAVLWALVRPGLWRPDPGPADLTDLAGALARLALGRAPGAHPGRRLHEAAGWCRQVTGRGSEVDLLIHGPDGVDVAASTSDAAGSWSRAQLDARQGPLVDVLHGTEVSRSADLGADDRFPAMADSIPGRHTVISRPLSLDDSVAGVMTVYDASPDILGENDVVMPSLVAATAVIATEVRGSSAVDGS